MSFEIFEVKTDNDNIVILMRCDKNVTLLSLTMFSSIEYISMITNNNNDHCPKKDGD